MILGEEEQEHRAFEGSMLSKSKKLMRREAGTMQGPGIKSDK